MAITVEWDNPEHTIALMHFSSGWTWNELFRAIDDYKAMVMNSPWNVQLIIVIAEQKLPPHDFVLNAREISRVVPAHSWSGFIVTRSPAMRMTFKTLYNLKYPSVTGFQLSDSVEDARQQLQQLYPTTDQY